MNVNIEITKDDDELLREAIWNFSAAWNMHNPKYMAAGWIEDGDLINPYGHLAVGRTAVEKLFAVEQTSIFAKTIYAVTNVRRIFHVSSRDVAVATYDAVIKQMRAPDGTPWEPLIHIGTVVLVRTGERWMVASARPAAIAPLPPWASPWIAGLGPDLPL